MSKLVYLAGPITGLNFGEATDWRNDAIRFLHKHGITGLSPMRHKEYLSSEKSLAAAGYDEHVLSTARAIMTRDRFDATRCDVLLVNLLGAQKISIGTVMEIAFADMKRTPIVCAMEKGAIHEHAMLNEAIGYRVDSLEAALDVVVAILGDPIIHEAQATKEAA